MPSTAAFSQQVGEYLQTLAAGLLSRPQAKHLRKFVLGLILCLVRRTFTNQARRYGYDRDASNIKRFLTDSGWDHEKVKQRHQQQLMAWLRRRPKRERIELIIDDTATHKYGRKMEGISKHYCDGKIRWGHCKVTLYVRVGLYKVPYDFRIYVTKDVCKKEGRPFATKIELALEMLKGFQPPPGRRVLVLFDTFYTSKAMLKYIHHERKWQFVARIESNRNVTYRGKKRCVRSLVKKRRSDFWEPLRIAAHDFVGHLFKVGLWHGIPGSLTVSRDEQNPDEVHFFISNRRDLAAGTIVRLYQHRWYIETYHRDVKQLLGLAHYQMRSFLGLQRYWLLVDVAYTVLSVQTCQSGVLQASAPGTDRSLTLGQLRQLALREAERQRLRELIEIWEKSRDLMAVFKAANC
jgi:SRSO17 transposase